jgi:UDP-glucose 4-epimerase
MPTRVLVTGGAGFIGSEVVSQLLVKGYDVTVVDDLSKPESSQKEGYAFVRADLTNPEAAKSVMEGQDFCIHLAAKIGGIGYFHKYPATILSENNKMYSSVFTAASNSDQLKRLVFISSSMVFESAVSFPSKESDIESVPIPKTPYGFSKLSGEWYCRAFHDEFGLEYAIIRPFNAYGPLEAPHEEIGYAHVIPDLVKKMLDGQYPLELLGDGAQTRCYTHVRDIARGIIAALEHPGAANEAFNISSGRETSVLELAKMLWMLTGQTKPFEWKSVPGFKYDIRRRVPDVSRAKEVLGFEASITLEQGLPEVVRWITETQSTRRV